ncbi:MAG: hypothetical protein DRP08_05775 [Candidatus Aenigmatarchaeota archaeon]|nr:MAG: hypothetical protein DRP08_05775 [Candidatus Aenigmarchaeota archaeon]
MIHLIYLTISILFLIFTIWLYYRHFELFLCLLIVINFEFFKILPPLGQFYAYRELLLPVIAFCLLERFFFSGKKFEFGKYSKIVLFFLIMSFLGILNAFWHGQPLILGIKAAKYFPLILIYFVLINKEFDVDKFIKYLIILGFLISIIMIIQYLLWGKLYFIHFTSEELGKMRLGRPRINIGAKFIALVGVISLGNFFKQKRFIYFLFYLYSFAYIITIAQTRMLIFGMLICGFLLFILNMKITPLTISVILATLCFAMPVSFIALKYARQFELVKMTETEIKEKKGSYLARINALKYYIKQIKKSPIVGYGLINFNWEKSPFPILQKRGIHIADIGIIDLVYKFGLIGVGWLIAFMFMVFKDIIGNKTVCINISGYFLLIFSVMATLDFFTKVDRIFLLGIFLGILTIILKENSQNTISYVEI